MDRIRFESSQPQIITSFLPEDVVIEILLKLPVKSLLKFRCVSKKWLSLISKSQFVKSHAQSPSRHRRRIFSNCFPPPLFSSYTLHPKFNTGAIEDDFVPFDFPFKEMKHRQIEIVGSCVGLVCLVINGAIGMLWNPATRESRVLPSSDTYIKKISSGFGYGFGYDAFNDDFKVVQSRGNITLEKPIRIYSLRSNSWRNVELKTHGPLVLIHISRGGVLSNGAIHWLAVLPEDQVKKHVIIAINLSKETCDFIPIPADYVTCYSSVVLGASEQNLLLANSDLSVLEKSVDIWMLKEYGVKESWIKIIHIPDFPHILEIPLVLFVSKNGEVIRKDHNDSKILHSYEFRSFSGIIEFGSTSYKESLISPSFNDEVDELPFMYNEDEFCGLRIDEV